MQVFISSPSSDGRHKEFGCKRKWKPGDNCGMTMASLTMQAQRPPEMARCKSSFRCGMQLTVIICVPRSTRESCYPSRHQAQSQYFPYPRVTLPIAYHHSYFEHV
ncbi:hypothetical protein PISMIDRAFT_190250 [Pisolithus microcarpus 441]|uniref:Uncharacterized protein n=1 Tax=Pisolithus microcarpus 441 TaxID=765257 RepID=A0A0C9YWZ5_9AGAM|nr:hypothetical protein PISMIDRAFT_190250 [Pisolithus microcarpus 441]